MARSPRSRSTVVALALLAAVVAGFAGVQSYESFVERPRRLAAAEGLADAAFEILPADVPAPDVALRGRDGKAFSIAEMKGQVVFVNFWATWCPPCRAEMPTMLQLGRELTRAHPGKFRMVAVSSDESWKEIDAYLLEAFGGQPPELTVALDTQAAVARAYYCLARGTCPPIQFPETYIVDKGGKLVGYVVADRNWSDPAARRYLEKLIEK